MTDVRTATRFPFHDPALPVEQRVDDLLMRLSVEDKAGLMFHEMTPINAVLPGKPNPADAIVGLKVNHFSVLGPVHDVAESALWHNELQRIAEGTGLGIPVTFSTDPRHAFTRNPGTASDAGALSQWPEALGLAALGDPALVRRFADIARQEYLALGLRVALHPQADLATEPRWSRILQTFGESADLTIELCREYIGGFRAGDEIGSDSVSCVVKHFPGGGPQKDGEDPHFEYGKEQVYSGDRWEYHLKPFRAAIDDGVSQVMPYYGVPMGTVYDEVGFGFNRGILHDLLRGELGFDGIILSDFGLINPSVIMGQPSPARAWGVEHLTPSQRIEVAIHAGVDQFGGESAPGLVVDLVRSGVVSESRIDESVRRLLREKFVLGLFDRRYLDVAHAVATVGRADFRAEGLAAQSAAIVRLTEAEAGPARLPVSGAGSVYVEGIDPIIAARLGAAVEDAATADYAVVRLDAPFAPRDGGFESLFHSGSLEFADEERDRILRVCAATPTIIVVHLDRPAVLTEIADAAAALLVEFGASDEALIDVLTGRTEARGRLPFDLPSSMEAVMASDTDAPFDTANPRFRFGEGLR